MLYPKYRTRMAAVCAVLGLLVSSAAASAKPKPKPRAEITGTISAISGSTVTVSNAEATVPLNVTSSTIIEVGGDRAPLSSLTTGMLVEASYDPATKNAFKIEAAENTTEAEVRGVALTVDPVTGQVGIDTNANGAVDLTVIANSGTELRIGKVTLPFSQIGLLKGLPVEVEYNSVTGVATKIHAEDVHELEASGTVTAVDLAARTLTVQTGTAAPVTYLVPEGAEIKILGRSASLADVQVGDRVSLSYVVNADGTRVALKVNVAAAKPQHVSGTLTAASGSTVTIATRTGSVTLTTSSTTDIRINGRSATVADLAAALATGRTVKVSAQYVQRGTTNLATRVHANVNGRGR
jgi:hypothetical protein